MRAYVSRTWHESAIPGNVDVLNFNDAELALAEASMILAESEPLNTPRTTHQTARLDRYASAGHQASMLALAESLASILPELDRLINDATGFEVAEAQWTGTGAWMLNLHSRNLATLRQMGA